MTTDTERLDFLEAEDLELHCSQEWGGWGIFIGDETPGTGPRFRGDTARLAIDNAMRALNAAKAAELKARLQ
jgi:hypothetical protein